MEQQTIKQGLDVLQQFGVMGTIAAGLVLVQIFYAWNVKKNAVDPTKEQDKQLDYLRENITKLWEKFDNHEQSIQDSRIEIERRLTRIWAEEKLLPRIDWLSNEFLQFKGEMSGRLISIEKEMKKGVNNGI